MRPPVSTVSPEGPNAPDGTLGRKEESEPGDRQRRGEERTGSLHPHKALSRLQTPLKHSDQESPSQCVEALGINLCAMPLCSHWVSLLAYVCLVSGF